jgi:non-homologous end joining protein Ku
MPRSTAPRRYVSNFTLQVGPISVSGSLTPLVSTESREATRFPFICPDCESVTQVRQGYTCAQGHGPFGPGDLARSRELPDGSWVRISEEEYVAARGSDLPANVLRVAVHPTDQIRLVPHGTSYVFAPAIADPTFAALMKLVDESGKAFVGVANLRGHEGVFQLQVHDGNLVIEKAVWPESLNEFEPVNVEPDVAIYGAALGMLDRIQVDFKADDYKSGSIARAKALTERLAGDQSLQQEANGEPEFPSSREDVLAILNQYAV